MEDINRLKNNDRFLHFDSTHECNNFIIYANNIGIKIGYRCCSNTGCCITDNTINIDYLKNNFKLNILNEIKENECPICFETTVFNIKCHGCNNLLCKKCGNQINKCPFCRTNLSPIIY